MPLSFPRSLKSSRPGRRSRNSCRSSAPAIVERLEDRTLLSTISWINTSGGDWDMPANWSGSVVPTSTDDVVINLPGITVTHGSGTDSVNSVTSQDPILLNGGSLAIASASTINNSLTVSGATLDVTGTLSVNGLFSLGFVSTLNGSGSVDTYGGVSFAGFNTLEGVTLNNHAGSTATWAATLVMLP